ncbi:hypothetical protein BGX33_002764 [Mortierella sp. NVP41]|nr:hypothetical protein BGX33_002764 [Mortierella sp. NVP41]
MATTTSNYKIREATESDMPQINGIVNHEIAVSINNFNYAPRSEQDGLAWFRSTIAGGYPIFVATTTIPGDGAEGEEKEVVAGTAEYSLYIHHEHRRRGLGKRLLKDLLVEAKKRNFHAIIGSISEDNEASIHLAKSFGFRVVGTMKENGYKFDRWIDNTFLELLL